MFTIETDNLKIEYIPKSRLHFLVTYEYSTIRCNKITVEDESTVYFQVDDEYVAWINLLEEEAGRINGYSTMMSHCESREIAGKQVSYAPMWELTMIDGVVGTFEHDDNEFFLTSKDGESKKVYLEETDGFAVMGFIAMLDKRRIDFLGE